MHKQLVTGFFAICASAAIASAQTPATPQTPTTQPTTRPSTAQTMPMNNNAKVTFEGCVQRGMAATSASPGAVGTSGTGSFVLANAKHAGAAGATAPSAGAPPAPATAANAGTSYRLEWDEAKLSPHVGHKVEVTGTLNDQSNTDTTSGNVAKTSGNSASLKVESVKMIAATCTMP